MSSQAVEIILRIKDEATGQIKTVAAGLGGLGDKAKTSDKAVEGMAGSLNKLMTLEWIKWLGQSASAMAQWFAGLVKSRAELERMAQTLNAPIEKIQGLQAVAAATGVSITDMGKALASTSEKDLAPLNRLVDEFGAKNGPAAASATRDWQAAMLGLNLAAAGVETKVLGLSGGFLEFGAGIVKSLAAVGLTLQAIADAIGRGFGIVFDNLWDRMNRLVARTVQVLQLVAAGDLQGLVALGKQSISENRSLDGIQAQQGKAVASDFTKSITDAALTLDNFGKSVDQLVTDLRTSVDLAPGLAASQGKAAPAAGGAFDVKLDLSDLDQGTQNELRTSKRQRQQLGEEAAAAMKAAADEVIRRANQSATNLGVASSTIRAGRSLMAGDIGGTVGMIGGPAGAAVGAGISGLQTLGTQGASGVAGALRENAMAIVAGIRELPKLITDVLPGLLADVIPALVAAVIEALPKLIVAQYEILGKLLVTSFKLAFQQLPEQIAEGLTRALFKLFQDLKEAITNPIRLNGGGLGKTLGTGARIGAGIATLGLSELAIAGFRGVRNAVRNQRGYASGARFVEEEGWARIHRGERIVPNSGVQDAATSRTMGGGGGLTVHFNGPVFGGQQGVRELVREINKVTGARGLREAVT